jgi:hypothetical protein
MVNGGVCVPHSQIVVHIIVLHVPDSGKIIKDLPLLHCRCGRQFLFTASMARKRLLHVIPVELGTPSTHRAATRTHGCSTHVMNDRVWVGVLEQAHGPRPR